jgi:plasmid stabilization system protein ParE
MELIWSDLATDSLKDILVYVEGFFGRTVSQKTSDRIISFIRSLERIPRLGRPVPDFQEYGEVRCTFYKKNHIYYWIRGEQIVLIIIWDGRQDPTRLYDILIDFLVNYPS